METKYPRLVLHQQRALACLRMLFGLLFLYAAWGKLSPHWISGFQHMMAEASSGTSRPPGFYEGFLRDAVVPNATLFAYLVVLGELAVGLCLVLGLFTGLAAAAGVLMNANYLLLTLPKGMLPVELNLIFIVAELALGFAYAGTTWGVDRYLVDKAPWWCLGFAHYEYREF